MADLSREQTAPACVECAMQNRSPILTLWGEREGERQHPTGGLGSVARQNKQKGVIKNQKH